MITEPMGYGVPRMCVAVDLEHYSWRPDAGQIEGFACKREQNWLGLSGCTEEDE